MRVITILLVASLTFALGGCKGKQEGRRSQSKEAEPMAFKLWSPAFANGESIPAKYTCSGDDISPELRWENGPRGTKSFALICDDPDAPFKTWVHWVIWAIPSSTTTLSEGVPPDPVLGDGTKQGTNDFKRLGYGGPCPPPGKPHRYFFKLYALDMIPDLKAGASKQDLLDAIEGHILAQAELVGTFKR